MKKIMGVSLWTWAAGIAVTLAAVAAIGQAVDIGSRRPKEAVATVASKNKFSPEIEMLGGAALLQIQLRSWAVDSVETCETDLDKQTLPGKAALAVIALNEAKASLAKYDAKVEAALGRLTAKEEPGGLLVEQLKEFCSYTESVIYEHSLSLKCSGYSPETKELFTESLRIRGSDRGGVSLDDVRRGQYESEVMQRVKAEREAQIERYRREANPR